MLGDAGEAGGATGDGREEAAGADGPCTGPEGAIPHGTLAMVAPYAAANWSTVGFSASRASRCFLHARISFSWSRFRF